MATYVPAAFFPPGTVSVTSTVTFYSLPAATTAVVRTIVGQSSAAAHTFTVDFANAADAAQTRLIDAYALTASVPAIFNGWWVNTTVTASAIGLKSDTATSNIVMGSVSGYTYT